MSGAAFRRVVGITALVVTTGCSFGLTQAPQRIADPAQPIACSDSASRPMLDLVGFTGAAGVAAIEDDLRRNGFSGAGAIEVGAIGVAAVYATAAVYGAHQVNRCSAARDLNVRCRGGDPQACVTLSPDWRPTSAPTLPSPAAPASERDGPAADAR